MKVALVGQPNCGKSTLFNRLTGAHQHVGNFPGVTVEQKRGRLRRHPDIEIVDLPGLYSLFPYSAEEALARDFLLDDPPDAVIQVLDATYPERHLYLTLQLLEFGIPMVLALNMMDEAQASGRTYDLSLLEERLGVPVLPLCASRGEGVEGLEEALLSLHRPIPRAFFSGDTSLAFLLRETGTLLSRAAEEANLPFPYLVSCAIMGEESVLHRLSLQKEEQARLQSLLTGLEDPVLSLVQARYDAVERLCAGVTASPESSGQNARTMRADRLLTHRLLSVPLFFVVLFAVFFLTFRVFGAFLQSLLALLLSAASSWVRQTLETIGTSEVLTLLLTDGILAGVGGVLLFLPTILVLFFFLSLLEDSGYLARVAFLLDRPMRRLGLSGRALVPILLGFGCSVPAIMATRTLSSRREKTLAILLLPFVACSAKIPLLTLVCSAFFAKDAPFVLFALYLFSVITGLLSTAFLSKRVLPGGSGAFLLELPPYRLPSPATVLLHMWEKAKEFVKKAFTVLLLATIAIWFLRSFDSSLHLVLQNESLLASIAKGFALLLSPLGIGDWRLAAALLSGLSAKEAVVSTLSVLFGAGEGDLAAVLKNSGVLPDISAALAFLVFFLLYLPCFAALSTISRELGKKRYALAAFAYQLAVAWLLAFAVYRVSMLFLIR